MNGRISDISTKRLLGEFLRYEELRMQAVRRLDVPEANKYVLKAAAAAEALSKTAEGRAEIEKLLGHATLYVRVRAAEAVMDWAPDKAIPVFGSMLDADLSSIPSVDERLDIRVISKDWLYKILRYPKFRPKRLNRAVEEVWRGAVVPGPCQVAVADNFAVP